MHTSDTFGTTMARANAIFLCLNHSPSYYIYCKKLGNEVAIKRRAFFAIRFITIVLANIRLKIADPPEIGRHLGKCKFESDVILSCMVDLKVKKNIVSAFDTGCMIHVLIQGV